MRSTQMCTLFKLLHCIRSINNPYESTYIMSSVKNIYYLKAGTPVGMGTGPHQVLAATLTLFQPGGADCAHHIVLMSPLSFESHRDACYICPKYIPNMILVVKNLRNSHHTSVEMGISWNIILVPGSAPLKISLKIQIDVCYWWKSSIERKGKFFFFLQIS